ncbi:MAG: AP2 domain-containing protein [Sedimentisphaerales bacterium]
MSVIVNFKLSIPQWLDRILVCPLLFCRWLSYGYSFRLLPLSRGKYAKVDQADYYNLVKFKWSVLDEGKNLYAVHTFFDEHTGKRVFVLLHRFIANPPADMVVDHENSDGLDDRRANLRVATQAQNVWNSRKTSKPTSSKYKGVYWHKKNRNWRACIHVNNRSIDLGSYDNQVDAARAYDRAAKKLRGVFARLNLPD